MSPDPVMVGGREIPAEVIAAEAQNHPAPSAEAAWQAAAEALAVRQLLVDEAERLGLEPDSGEGPELTREDALIDALLAREIQTPKADEETCRRFFDHHPERFTTPLLVEAAHILIEADPADDFALGLATGDARTLIRQLQAEPARFDELARTHSACPSREQGGNLGQVQAGQMVKPFQEALFALPSDTLCPDPVRTRFGVHVIRSGHRIEAKPLPFEAVRALIAEYLEEASYRRAVAQYIAILAEQAGVNGVELAA
ncbi:MAG: peptidylprolyl isomerase [Sphingomonadales bacterium]|nr:peptidylprolyl isomerase [Sphingomonadaceae bacterium]MBS3931894.1 peptidylprolyl isomerase [Sphingomonadales bacterium]